MSDTAKIRLVRKYHELLNDGKLEEAHEYLAPKLVANFSVGGGQLQKDDVLKANQQTLADSKAKVHIIDAKEEGESVIIVGKTELDHEVKEVPFRAIYTFDGDLIASAEFETDANFKIAAYTL